MSIRILIIAPRFGSITRGVETFTEELITRIDKSRFDVTVLSCLHDRKPIAGVRFIQRPAVLREQGEALFQIRLAAKLLSLVKIKFPAALETFTLMASSAPFLAREHFDVILPFGGSWSYFFAALFDRRAKIISVGHGGPARYELLKSAAFVALTPSAQEEAARLTPGIKIKIIPTSVDTTRFKPGPRKPARKQKIVLCAAAFVKEKRHDLLFAAAALLEQDILIRCTSSGPEKKRYLDHPLAKQGRIDFVEASYSEMPRIYQEADIFTLASTDEVCAAVLFEAMASGLNVVANDDPRQRFILGGVGFYCDVTNTPAYTRTIMEALSTDRRERSVERARQFDWAKGAKQYEQIFNEVTS